MTFAWIPVGCAAALLIVSITAHMRAEHRRPFAPWPSDADRVRHHLTAITTALWAIVALLAAIAL